MSYEVQINDVAFVKTQTALGDFVSVFQGDPEKLKDYLDEKGVKPNGNLHVRVQDHWGRTAQLTLDSIRVTVDTDQQDAYRWRKFCEALDEGRVSVILENAFHAIGEGEIVTDVDAVLEHIL